METNRKPFSGKRRYSIRTELTFVFFLLIAGAIMIIFLANTFFLERYYLKDKQKALDKAYVKLNQAAADNSIRTSKFGVELVQIASKDNIGVIVMDDDSKTIKYYASDAETMVKRMWDNMFEKTDSLPSGYSEGEADQSEHNGNSSDDPGDYYIVKRLQDSYNQRVQIVLDRKTSTQYMEMWGMLGDGSFYLLRTAVESIRKNSGIANHFIILVGICVILLGALVAALLGTRITRPILQLTRISQRMKLLDFSARYEGDDRTEIAELGENFNELSSTLEKTISELKTANNELRSDIEKKEKIEQMQREFIANVTHELKTPIALIQGYAEGLQDGIAQDADSRDFYTGVILDEAGKMNKMVQKLLTLTHLEFGSEKAEMTRFDAAQLILSELSSAVLLANENDIHVRITQAQTGSQDVHTDETGRIYLDQELSPVYVWSDEFMTEEVFQNYFSNAVHHAKSVEKQGSGQKDKVIDIRFEQKENCVRISVFNTGDPIPEDSVGRIWEKFYKVDKARTRAYGGSGVGLSIVKAIMELLHQDYGVINYDNGVEFWFELETAAKSRQTAEET